MVLSFGSSPVAADDGAEVIARRVPTSRSDRESCRAPLLRSRRQSELLDPVAHLIAIDTEQTSRVGLIPVGAIQRLQKEIAFDLFEIEPVGRQLEAGRTRPARQRRKVLGGQPFVLDE